MIYNYLHDIQNLFSKKKKYTETYHTYSVKENTWIVYGESRTYIVENIKDLNKTYITIISKIHIINDNYNLGDSLKKQRIFKYSF